MMLFLQYRQWAAWTLIPVAGLAVMAASANRAPDLALVNESPSLPEGLYVRQADAPIAHGSVVAIAQPSSIRPYLATLGMPAEVKLIKRVAAVGGDRVCAEEGAVRTPSRVSPVLARDRRGVALPTWDGCRTLGPDELFLLGDTPGSFDSRYFGPVHRAEVDGVYKETLTW
ncbi:MULTISPECIES: S26 family signal peptidase [unclassified Brevundimonas]|jgi:type IV secretory pathway protease TraF|uniref:S26 family signal peptidase n=1 Tax=unclassified Brevundimonas TaxID=2622653 RepID=UPI0012A95ABB|nr:MULTISPECIES: S26 family signal peptidase [unclassified Brevundimonas]MCG2663390.1 S26 family signal peptidase [Brevundimonas sp.]QFU32362.1 Peptidase S26 [Brevundimonas sp. Bb-A]